jgi:hypothetical protein
MIMKYFINHNTGAGNEYISGTLQEAKEAADAGIRYTQKDVVIENDGEEVARRVWTGGLEDIELFSNPIQFGDFGYYADWSDEE